jgi:hypothetical protein
MWNGGDFGGLMELSIGCTYNHEEKSTVYELKSVNYLEVE